MQKIVASRKRRHPNVTDDMFVRTRPMFETQNKSSWELSCLPAHLAERLSHTKESPKSKSLPLTSAIQFVVSHITWRVRSVA
jgi:hypothetical protein